jgi:hypothetical protein
LDLKKLTPGEMIIGVSGVLLLIFSFFKWYGASGAAADAAEALGIRTSSNGWQSPSAFLSVVAILIGVVMATHVIVTKLGGVDLPERIGSIGWGVFYLAGGVIAFVFVLIKWLSNTDGTKFGIYAGLLCTAGLAVGGFMVAKDRGHLAELTGGGGGGSTPPSAPPTA